MNKQQNSIKLICPDCKSKLSGSTHCNSCNWHIEKVSNEVISLLPSELSKEKINENLIHLDDKESSVLWKDILFKKKFYIDRLLKYWKENFLDAQKKSFLEIGGGYCYISCAVKYLRPDVSVWATDVSPSYLSLKSSRLASFFDVKIDQYAAVDAENLPFEDESFDIIFISHSIHHVGNTAKFFKEANRVLTKSGVFYGVDIAAPKLDYFYKKDAESRALRGEPLGIHERSIKLNQYVSDLEAAGIKKYTIKHEKNRISKDIIDLKIKNYWKGVTIALSFPKN